MSRMHEQSWRLEHNAPRLAPTVAAVAIDCTWDAVAGLDCPTHPATPVTELGRTDWGGHALCAEHLHAVGLGPCPHPHATLVDPADRGQGARCDVCGTVVPVWSPGPADPQQDNSFSGVAYCEIAVELAGGLDLDYLDSAYVARARQRAESSGWPWPPTPAAVDAHLRRARGQ